MNSECSRIATTNEWRHALRLLGLCVLAWMVLQTQLGDLIEFSLSTYLPIHTALEVASLMLASLAVALFLRMPQSSRTLGTTLLATALLGGAAADFLHFMSYAGMPSLVTPSGPEKAIAFWFVGRGVMTLGLFAIAFMPVALRWKVPGTLAIQLALLALVVASSWLVLLHPEVLPRTYFPGVGLTRLKVTIEWLLVAGLVAAAVRLVVVSRQTGALYAIPLATAAATAALGEVCLASYATITDTLNLLGHVCKIVAYWQIVRAAYLLAVRQPLQDISGLAEALQAMMNPTLICDADGRIRWVNRAFEAATGFLRAEVEGKSISSLSLDTHACEQHQTMAAVANGTAWQGEVKALRRDGSVYVDGRSVTPIRNAQGHLTGFVIVGDDVTERLRAASALAESAERLRVILQSAPDAVVVIDARGIVQMANPQVTALFGYAEAELLGSNVRMLMSEQTAAQHDDHLLRYAATRQRHIIGIGRDLEGQRKDGVKLHLHLTVGEATLPSGTVYIGFMRDISEHVQAQAELAEREARYRALMDTAADGVWITDLQGRILATNEAYLSRSGYSREEMLRLRIADMDAAMAPAEVDSAIHRVIAAGRLRFETVHRDKAGHPWPVEMSATYWAFGEGQLFVFMRDLTQHKAAELALRQTEERFELALRGANDGLWDRNLLDDSIYYSPRWKEMLGYRDDELENSRATFAALLHPEDSLRVHLTLREIAFGEGIDRFAMEMRLRHKQGHWVHVLSRAQLMRNAQGQLARLIGTHQDLTEQKLAEQALRQSEDKLRNLFELSPLGIALCTMDGALVDFNEAYRQITGYSAEALRKLTYWELTPDEYMAGESEQLNVIARTGRYGPFEKEYCRADGTLVPVRLNGVQMDINGEPHLWSIVEDLTVTRHLESERHTMQRQQLQSQKLEALGHLTGGIAHDFNNMLAGIMGLAGLGLERHVADADGKLARYLKEIVRTCERGRDLVAKMLAYAHTEGHEVVAARDVGPLVSEMRDMLSTSIPAGISLSCVVEPELPAVRISAVDVHQIVMNLVINARDAIGEHGHIKLALREVMLHREACAGCPECASGRHVMLEIQDDGCGVAHEVLPKIFDPFFTTKGVGKGTGLGLSSVLGIIHRAGGHVQVKSSAGRGTSIRVLLPAEVVAVKEPVERPAPSEPLPLGGAKVWVVDDDPAVLVFLTELLRDHGVDVQAYSDPVQALREMQQSRQPPRVLITDQTMPGVSGTKLALATMKAHPEVAVILCTGYSERIDEASAAKLGIRCFLRKPFDTRQLLDALTDALQAPVYSG